jgi:O-antigen/teichoic acid export membrane protein
MNKVASQLAFLTASRYIIYLLVFCRGLLIAKVFSQEEYADWGLVMFVSAYYSIVGFGIPNLVLLSVEKYSSGSKEISKVVGAALIYVAALAAITSLFILVLPGVFYELGKSISVQGMIILAFGLVAIETLRNFARIAGNYRNIVLADAVSILPLFLLLLLVPGYLDPQRALWSLNVGVLCSLLILSKHYSFEFSFKDLSLFGREIIIRGLPILFYNYSSYSLFLIFRTDILNSGQDRLISDFNFAWLLSNSVIMLIGLLNWYYYPVLLKKINENQDNKFRIMYGEVMLPQLIIGVVVLFFAPILAKFAIDILFVKYQGSFVHFKHLLSAQVLLYLTFYSSTYLVAQKRNPILYFSGLLASGLLFLSLLSSAKYYALDLDLKYVILNISCLIFFLILHLSTPLSNNRLVVVVLLLSVVGINYVILPFKLFIFIYAVFQAYRKRSAIRILLSKLNETNHNI